MAVDLAKYSKKSLEQNKKWGGGQSKECGRQNKEKKFPVVKKGSEKMRRSSEN